MSPAESGSLAVVLRHPRRGKPCYRIRIDVHHHVLTTEYVEALAAVGIVEAGGVPFPNWTPDASLAMLDRAGIQAAILSLSAPGLPFGDADRTRTLARSANRQVFGSLQHLVPSTHILLGTDYPFAPEMESGVTLHRLDTLPGLSDEEREDITSHNALGLFPRFQR